MSTGNLHTPTPMFHVKPSASYDPDGSSKRGTHATKYVKQCHGECTFPPFIIHRERSYCYISVEECVDHSVSTRTTQACKQRGSGTVGSSMARLNKGTASSQFSRQESVACACSHSLAMPVMTGVHPSVFLRQSLQWLVLLCR